MQAWEYATQLVAQSSTDTDEGIAVDFDMGGKPLRDALDKMGENGWELVAAVPLIEAGHLLYFKRPK